jgi:transcriptional regulator with GAF, ATPase, and Fis domain
MTMTPFQELLLGVWREAGRHTDMATSTINIAQLLAHWMPIEQVVVRRIEPERSCLETVGIGTDKILPRLLGERSDCSPTHLQALLAWCHHGAAMLRRRGGGNATELEAAVAPALDEELLIGPLVSEHGTCGLILLLAARGQCFTPLHQRMLQAILEPLAAALENDRRLRELTALREAAEADKQSLLRRLGRTQVTDTIVGADGRLRPVMERVTLVSPSDVPVLILGETGSGKEVIARAIHMRSARAAGPFIRVNCGAIPPDLIDSELFGHEKGSFTGAVGTRRGWFERADEGTLFLDEIGELPPAAQVRLLRVLQEGVFERVGGEHSIKVDVRIVTATHQDLATMVQYGRFREDLWYRIAVFPIVLPPLREHPEDIAALAEHFAQRAAVRFGLTPQLPSPQDIALLTDYAWPGNVRELAAVIDRATILGAGKRLEVGKALGLLPGVYPLPSTTDDPPPAQRSLASTCLSLDAAMTQHIEAALEVTRGRIEGPHGAAHLLGINPYTLRGRMRKLGIDWTKFRSVPFPSMGAASSYAIVARQG